MGRRVAAGDQKIIAMGGLTQEYLERLILLYDQAAMYGVYSRHDEAKKRKRLWLYKAAVYHGTP